ncbi:MAG: VCBS repeat-containing protein [Candidatus Hydrogenedentes bacterium]|nr:VCBS repeat-containing protein [Candidatus Hydrogenedentota bacterium]
MRTLHGNNYVSVTGHAVLFYSLSLTSLFAAATASGAVFEKYGRTFQVGPNPSTIAIADLNGDGWPEILTANVGRLGDPNEELPANDEVSFLLAAGNLTYVSQPPLRSGYAPYGIVVANLDALKAPDVVVGSFMATRDRHLTLFRNIGDNLFETIYFSATADGLAYTKHLDGDGQPVFPKPGITAVAVTDINHDSYRDVIATGWTSDVVLVFPGVPEGYLGAPKALRASGGPRDLVVADLDADGEPDLAATLYSIGELAVWKGNPNGEFVPAGRFASRGKLPHRIRSGDMNGDGKTDLVVSHCHAEDSVVIFYGEGNLQFGTSQEINLGTDRAILEHEIRDIVLGDFNGDRRTDVAAACFRSGQVTILINTSADGRIPQDFSSENIRFSEDAAPRALAVGDLNQDGALDLAVALWKSNSVSLLLGSAKK